MNQQPNVSNPSAPTNYSNSQSVALPETIRVLVAEDNEINLLIMVAVLRKWDKTKLLVDSAVNGQQVVDMVQRNSYDLILMDCQMPIMDGYKAARYIRKKLESPKCHIPIIAVTASIPSSPGNISEEEKLVYKSGMNDFVAKPFEPTHLFEKMITLLTSTSSLADIVSPARNQSTLPNAYDLSFLRSAIGGDDQALVGIIRKFLDTMPFELSDMQESINSLQFSQMAAIAHRIRSNARSLGINEVVSTLEVMEYKGKTVHETLMLDEMIGYFGTIQSVFARAITGLSEELPLIEQALRERELQTV